MTDQERLEAIESAKLTIIRGFDQLFNAIVLRDAERVLTHGVLAVVEATFTEDGQKHLIVQPVGDVPPWAQKGMAEYALALLQNGGVVA